MRFITEVLSFVLCYALYDLTVLWSSWKRLEESLDLIVVLFALPPFLKVLQESRDLF